MKAWRVTDLVERSCTVVWSDSPQDAKMAAIAHVRPHGGARSFMVQRIRGYDNCEHLVPEQPIACSDVALILKTA